MLGSSSVSSRDVGRDVAGPVRTAPVHRAVLTGDTIPVLTGFGATLALVLVK